VTSVERTTSALDIQTLEQGVADLVAQRRLIMLLIASFAMLASFSPPSALWSLRLLRQSAPAGNGHPPRSRLHAGGVLRLVVMQAAQSCRPGWHSGLKHCFGSEQAPGQPARRRHVRMIRWLSRLLGSHDRRSAVSEQHTQRRLRDRLLSVLHSEQPRQEFEIESGYTATPPMAGKDNGQ